MPSLWLVDGSHTIFRAYHALPHLSTRQGVPTNAVYGFTTMLLRAIREGNPTHLAVAGDKIDNIPGVPGVGEKTAAGLLKEYGTLENVLANAAGVKKPKLRENLLASLDAVRRARQLISLYEELPLPVQLEDLERKPVDEPQARKLFTELEFVRLVNDLPRPAPTPPSGARSMATTLEHVQRLVDKARAANRFALLTLTSEDEPLRDDLLGLAVSLPDESVYVPLGHRAGISGALFAPAELNAVKAIALLKPLLEDPNIIKDGHDLKRDVDAWRRAGVSLSGLGIDSRLASYLIDPTGRDHSLVQTARERISCELPLLKELCERTGKGRKATPLAEVPVDETSAAACALVEGARRLCEALGEDLRADQELLGLYADMEKPLIEVLANLELTGIRIDVPRLQKLSDELGRQIDALLQEIYQLAGREFLPGSTQQLAEGLYKKLNLPVLKRA